MLFDLVWYLWCTCWLGLLVRLFCLGLVIWVLLWFTRYFVDFGLNDWFCVFLFCCFVSDFCWVLVVVLILDCRFALCVVGGNCLLCGWRFSFVWID